MSSYTFEFTTKKGRSALLRYPTIEDAPALMSFINTFSLEDSFTRFAGEQISLEEELTYLKSEIEKIENGTNAKLFCFIDSKLAGVCDVHRDDSLWTRKIHGGIFGLIIGQEYRGEGVGTMLSTETIKQAQEIIKGLKIIKLDCFASNTPALELYRKIGFVEVGRVPKALYRKNAYDDEVIMVKNLYF